MNRRIYKGIPDSLRGEVWYRLLDIGRIKQEQNGVYEVYSTFFQKERLNDDIAYFSPQFIFAFN